MNISLFSYAWSVWWKAGGVAEQKEYPSVGFNVGRLLSLYVPVEAWLSGWARGVGKTKDVSLTLFIYSLTKVRLAKEMDREPPRRARLELHEHGTVTAL